MSAEKNRFDNAWKDVVRDLFFEFLDFYYPDLSREVDHQIPPRSREKEFAKLLPDNHSSGRRVDLLFQVRMISSEIRTLLLHIEVQNRKEEALPMRLFQYAYRIFDREGSFPATLLLLTDSDPDFFPTEYRLQLAQGKFLRLDFFTQKLLYLKKELSETEPNQNPFAFITAAHLEALKASTTRKRSLFWRRSVCLM
jgi:hypothetical protein